MPGFTQVTEQLQSGYIKYGDFFVGKIEYIKKGADFWCYSSLSTVTLHFVDDDETVVKVFVLS